MNFLCKLVLLFATMSLYRNANGSLDEKVEEFVSSRNEDAKIWALLVAGSNGWWNYRHQADVCHSYQILHKHGIADENIVVMMYDDLANNDENPTPGKIINQPNGADVYQGVVKDYTGKDVNVDNFLQILQGDAPSMNGIGSGKVIASGPNDHVFVNFVDHGAPGLLAFPDTILTSSELIKAIKNMHSKQQYAKMVLYIEACEAGSMFEGLLEEDINVYVATASNADESSYACYYDSSRDTYLGDVFSVKWMENSDGSNIEAETIASQIKTVTKETDTSHVSQYGDESLANLDVGQFQGEVNGADEPTSTQPNPNLDAIESPMVKLNILKRRLLSTNDHEQQITLVTQISNHLKEISQITSTVKQILDAIPGLTNEFIQSLFDEKQVKLSQDRTCYENSIQQFRLKCLQPSQYESALRLAYVFANVCENGVEQDKIEQAIEGVCEGESLSLKEDL